MRVGVSDLLQDVESHVLQSREQEASPCRTSAVRRTGMGQRRSPSRPSTGEGAAPSGRVAVAVVDLVFGPATRGNGARRTGRVRVPTRRSAAAGHRHDREQNGRPLFSTTVHRRPAVRPGAPQGGAEQRPGRAEAGDGPGTRGGGRDGVPAASRRRYAVVGWGGVMVAKTLNVPLVGAERHGPPHVPAQRGGSRARGGRPGSPVPSPSPNSSSSAPQWVSAGVRRCTSARSAPRLRWRSSARRAPRGISPQDQRSGPLLGRCRHGGGDGDVSGEDRETGERLRDGVHLLGPAQQQAGEDYGTGQRGVGRCRQPLVITVTGGGRWREKNVHVRQATRVRQGRTARRMKLR